MTKPTDPARSAGARPAAAPFTVVHPITPRFRDTDAMGHVNNAVYITYLEVARQAYWREATGAHDYAAVPFILAGVSCDFRSEALVHEVLDVGIRCAWIGSKSFAFDYQIRDHATGRLVVEATTVQVCYDYEAKRSIVMPETLRRTLETMEGRSLAR